MPALNRPAFLALALGALSALGQTPPPFPVEREAPAAEVPDAGPPQGVLTKAPALLKKVEAAFPAEALDAGAGGTVQLEIDIGPDGKVMDARVTGSAGHGFDQAALDAVKQFEFSPAEVDGLPAAVRIAYSYEFFFTAQVTELPVAPLEELVNFSGVLVERGTRTPIASASIAIGSGDKVREVSSDAEGRFEVKGVPLGTQRVVVTSADHTRYEATEEIREGQRTEVTYFVRRKLYGAMETVVRGEREKKEVAQVSLRQEEIKLIPGTQGDALKVVQNLPGVARAPFSMGILVVRGGKPWDTRVYVDDALIPLLFHFGGLNATFNSNLLEEISFQPGNFGAGYGRNIAGLVNATTRVPSKEGYHGYLDLNVIDGSMMLEGPVNEDWSFALGGRRSWIDAVLPFALHTFAPQVNLSFTVAPRYYDYQLQFVRKPKGSQGKLSITFFGSNDQLSFVMPNPALDPEGRGSVETLMAYNRLAVNYERALSPNLKLIANNVLGYDTYNFGGGADLYLRSTQFPFMGREGFELELPAQALSLSFGTDLYLLPYVYEVQSPPMFKLNQIPDPFVSRRLVREAATETTFEPALYAEAVWKPLEKLKLVGGVRADYETLMQKGWVDPRAAAFYALTGSTSVKAAVGLFHQPPDYRLGMLSKTFGNPNLLPEAAAHYTVGVEHKFTDAISVDVQAYYKDLFHQTRTTLAMDSGSSANIDTVDLAYTSDGVGRSYGVELLLRHQLTRNFFGWIAYSLSRSDRYYQLSGKWALHPLDQTHNLIAIASYKLPYDFIVGVRLRYATGALSTPFVGAIYDANGNYYFPLLGELFGRRLPPFFQADLRIDKRFVFEKWMLAVYADVMNATNRGNVEGVMNNFDYTREQYLYGLPIIPALGVRGEF